MHFLTPDLQTLWDIGASSIHKLEIESGILASGREELYGCIFGRDSLITALQLLEVARDRPDPSFFPLVKKILLNLLQLQGREECIESGEEPGKCIHEYRPTDHDHLTKRAVRPWYTYSDGSMRNYDSVDATPLLLIAVHEYYVATKDEEFMQHVLPHAYAALNWILDSGDKNGDGLIDYAFDTRRTYGGLTTQSWMDSGESLFHEDGSEPVYPIAPVEVQAYVYKTLRLFEKLLRRYNEPYAQCLSVRADNLKRVFNERYIIRAGSSFSLASAIDGRGRQLTSVRSSMGHVLWASLKKDDMSLECIVDSEYIPNLVSRLMQPDLFEPNAGIRTLSSLSRGFHPMSYHNGSIWPHDTSMIITGLEQFGYAHEASQIREALLTSYTYFKTPLELFVFDGTHQEYCSSSGQRACRIQAWSAASLLKEVVSHARDKQRSYTQV